LTRRQIPLFYITSYFMSEPPNREVDVYNEALQLPAWQRAVYLDGACAGDAALRQRVEALLQLHEGAGDFFESLEREAPPSSAIPAEKHGDRIGRYKVLGQIGEGGCGGVYLAEQERLVHRRVNGFADFGFRGNGAV
jgi:eukaryotic-like serine/threonine-protein kinase